MSAALSHKQKRYLSELAARAFDRADVEADGNLYPGLAVSTARGEFRREQVVQACGKAGLRCCSQDDYKLVEAHLLKLCREDARAFNAGVAAHTDGVRRARHILRDELEQAGLAPAYAAAICRNQFKVELDSASEKQVWALIFTIRNRAKARRRTQPFPAAARSHVTRPPNPPRTVSAAAASAGK